MWKNGKIQSFYEFYRKVENRLIKPFLNNKWCLNEHCGGSYSIDHLRKIGKRQYENKVGIHTQTIQDRIEMGKKIWNSGKGLASISKEQWKHNASLGGSTGAGAKVVGNLMKIQKRAIFSLNSTQLSENAKKAAAQKWKCTITGHISNAGGLTRYQKSRKIDISNRIRLS